MNEITKPDAQTPSLWRYGVIAAVVFGSLAVMMLRPPIAQDQAYHAFADARPLFGIPNFGDVASNLAFLLVGAAGLWSCFRQRFGPLHNAWLVMFAGIATVGIASSYYHWNPNDQTLVWDRMTLTVGFMGLFIALVGEFVDRRLGRLLVPAVVLGAASVVYWHYADDLRPYYWVQMVPLLIVPVAIALFRSPFSHQWMILLGAVLYGVAKLTELGDKVIFSATAGTISGHTLKHLFAGAGCLAILAALKIRRPLETAR